MKASDALTFPRTLLLTSCTGKTRGDGRFAKHWDDTPLSASATALRQFVLDPDAASLERVGAETGNIGFIDEVRQRRRESVAAAFKRACRSGRAIA
jgi:hypothetical protein